jgi:hypothetical protein
MQPNAALIEILKQTGELDYAEPSADRAGSTTSACSTTMRSHDATARVLLSLPPTPERDSVAPRRRPARLRLPPEFLARAPNATTLARPAMVSNNFGWCPGIRTCSASTAGLEMA